MAEYYTKAQVDAQAAVIGSRIGEATGADAIQVAYESNTDRNAFTDAEKAKLAALESSKFRGTFTSLANIPAGTGAGDYAYTDDGSSATRLAIWDVDDAVWRDQGPTGSSETAATVKTKYESNADTNAFTDAEKTKLAGLVEAADISSFTAALDAAIAGGAN